MSNGASRILLCVLCASVFQTFDLSIRVSIASPERGRWKHRGMESTERLAARKSWTAYGLTESTGDVVFGFF